jgi:hypothetical protein
MVLVFYPSIFFARSRHRRWPGALLRFLLLLHLCRRAYVSAPPLPHPECGLQDTGISTDLEGSRPISSLAGSGKDGHCTHDNGRENSQDGYSLCNRCFIGSSLCNLVFF